MYLWRWRRIWWLLLNSSLELDEHSIDSLEFEPHLRDFLCLQFFLPLCFDICFSVSFVVKPRQDRLSKLYTYVFLHAAYRERSIWNFCAIWRQELLSCAWNVTSPVENACELCIPTTVERSSKLVSGLSRYKWTKSYECSPKEYEIKRLIGAVKSAMSNVIAGSYLSWDELSKVMLDIKIQINRRHWRISRMKSNYQPQHHSLSYNRALSSFQKKSPSESMNVI